MTRDPNNADATDAAPLVSVIVPSYNHAGFVEQSIRSIWEQDYPNVEVIVIDDASTDGSGELISRLASQSPIPMAVHIKSRNGGISESLNIGVSLAKGEWISILSSDDWFVANKISRQMRIAAEHGVDFGCIHSDAYSVTQDGKPRGTNFSRAGVRALHGEAFEDLIYNRARIIATSSLLRKDLVDRCGRFDESFIAEDYDFYLRLARLTKFYFLNEPLVNVRVSPQSLGRRPWQWLDSIFGALDKHRDVPNYDWERVKAERWLTLLPNFLENGNRAQISQVLSLSFGQARNAGITGRYAGSLARSATRAVAFRVKRRMVGRA